MKEQLKAPEKNTIKGQRDSQPIRYRVQNTGYQDAPGTHCLKKTQAAMKIALCEIKKNL